MKLINSNTKKEIKNGDQITTFRGEKGVLTGSQAPKHEGSTGRVFVKIEGRLFDDSYYPSVIDAEWSNS